MPLRKLVTGVTGFVGSHLAYRLLKDGHHVIALARGGKNVSAHERVVEVLSEVAGSPDDVQIHLARLQVLEGDIAQPLLGLSPDGPWIDAKSIVKVMATKAPKDSTIYFRAEGTDAKAALEALVTLVDGDFQDGR